MLLSHKIHNFRVMNLIQHTQIPLSLHRNIHNKNMLSQANLSPCFNYQW